MKVLIIDDDEVNNFLCKKVMELCNFSDEVHTCYSVQKAIDYLKGLKEKKSDKYPDLIFLDINMPTNTGWYFLEKYEEWAEESTADSLKIYMLSSSEYEEDINRAEAHPLITQYITKPLKKEILESLK